MKKVILLFILIIPLIVRAQINQGYTIKGSIDNAPDGPVVVKNMYNGDTVISGIIKSGHFVLENKKKFLGVATTLHINEKKIMSNLFIEPGTIYLSGDYNNPISIKASGTASNDAWNIYLTKVAPYEDMIASVKKAYSLENDTVKKKELSAGSSKAYDDYYQFRRSFATKYNNTIIAPMFLSAGTGNLDYKGLCELMDIFDKSIPDNWYLKRLKERREIMSKIDYGKEAPDFTLKNPDGEKITLSKYHGDIVLVDFWASWCKPCRAENINLIDLYNRYNPRGFTILSVSIDENKDKWVKAINDDNLPWDTHVSSLVGWECPVARLFGLGFGMTGVPYSILLDREGKLCGYNLRGEDLKIKLQEIFGE